MRRRDFIKVVACSAITWPLAARAQQAERMRRLGVLMAVAESDADAHKGISILQDRLQKLGWKDGNNIHRLSLGQWRPRSHSRVRQRASRTATRCSRSHSTPSAKGLLKQTP